MNISTRRTTFLEECGVGPLWVRRYAVPYQEIVQIEYAPLETVAPLVPVVATVEPITPTVVTPVLSQIPAVDDMMTAWDNAPSSVPAVIVAAPKLDLHNAAADAVALKANIATMDWRQLKAAVAECTQCGLCHGREHTVFGVGDESAKWLFIGEGPGREEDRQGEPFVGPAGKLLDNMLASVGVKRGENAYIANIVKCRSTDDNGRDRTPSAEEVAACLPYLQRQIALIQPTVLVALGKTAALSLLALDPTTPVSTLRGTVHRYAGLPLVVTYHPAYLLRKPSEKAKAWDDLCLALRCYAPAAE
ncbi:uracil-DNA glycosylase family protein [Glaciimonas sp. PCH181]|uniref:uracil-DNA glycosylase n=1 Tax=Glaciimonas sp. PCH181 TaxID=2133943 RepID=UPI000D37F71B|nr:uracil-DNA glycosylase [Glaciimonas sp. PCH181]PUA18525.1 DNA polymerase III [Glaciimonas sp. PCH181]